jgi:hypothetical protein
MQKQKDTKHKKSSVYKTVRMSRTENQVMTRVFMLQEEIEIDTNGKETIVKRAHNADGGEAHIHLQRSYVE